MDIPNGYTNKHAAASKDDSVGADVVDGAGIGAFGVR